jgi:hypothetical protein
MNTDRPQRCLILLPLLLAATSARAQYDFGSDGSSGAITVTTGTVTIPLPENGVIHATTVTVSGGTLQFGRNSRNTDVKLLATGDIVIAAGATVHVNGDLGTATAAGAGGPGGFDGGAPGPGGGAPSGDGKGPGGGMAGTQNAGDGPGGGGYRTAGTGVRGGPAYGSSTLVPLIGGGGGGGRNNTGGAAGSERGGAGGGGALLLASNTRIQIAGRVEAQGANGPASGGAGGGVRLLAPEVDMPGSGTVDVGGGSGAGDGYIRVDTIDRGGLAINRLVPSGSASVGSFMAVAPTVGAGRMDIVFAAGTSIPLDSPPPGTIVVPSPSQQVIVQADGFNEITNVRVAMIPESGPATYFDRVIDNTSGPGSAVVILNLPLNVRCEVQAWTVP